jgi:hypothetical protein
MSLTYTRPTRLVAKGVAPPAAGRGIKGVARHRRCGRTHVAGVHRELVGVAIAGGGVGAYAAVGHRRAGDGC